jgi:hypothetical protein
MFSLPMPVSQPKKSSPAAQGSEGLTLMLSRNGYFKAHLGANVG